MKKPSVMFSVKGFGIGAWIQDYPGYPVMKILSITFMFWTFFWRLKNDQKN